MKSRILLLLYFICIVVQVLCDPYNLGGKPGEGYIIEVMIGTPEQKFNVLIDTGSTNFAIAAAPHPNIDCFFVRNNSTSYADLQEDVLLQYTQGRWSGHLASDTVHFPTLNSVLSVTCDIAFITESSSFFMNGSNWQGILGLAYPAIARPSSSVRPWLESLQRKNKDKTIAFALTLCGTRKPGSNTHYGSFEVLNNVVEPIRGLMTARVVREWFYEVIMTGLQVDGHTVPVDCRSLNTDKTIIDSGTTNVRFPQPVFDIIVKMLVTASETANKKATERLLLTQKKSNINRTVPSVTEKSSLLPRVLGDDFWLKERSACFDSLQNWDDMPIITIQLASGPNEYFNLNIPGSSYIRQVFENTEPMFCYKFSIEASESGSTLGVVAMEGFKVIFNKTARNVGFLKSQCGPGVSLRGPFRSNQTGDHDFLSGCSHTEVVHISLLNIGAYVVCAALLLSSLMFAYLLGQWLRDKYFRYNSSGATVSMSHTSLINEE